MNISKKVVPLMLMFLAATALPAKADPQFCMYEDPAKPGDNLRYRGDFRREYPASAPGCQFVSKGMPNPGGTETILWPDGVTTKIVIKTKRVKSRLEGFVGTATVDGELADWAAYEGYCFIIRANQKKICY